MKKNHYKFLCIVFASTVVLLGLTLILQNNRISDLSSRLDYYEEPVTEAAEHIIAHRGASGEEQEHTFESYDLAIEYGAKYIEQDLIFSKDGTLYVHHDASIKNADGSKTKISDCSDNDLNSMGVISMESVLDRYESNDVVFVIEVRAPEGDNYNGKTQIEALLELLNNYNLSDRIIIQGWQEEPLKAAKDYDSRIRTMFLTADQNGINCAIQSNYVDIVSAIVDCMTAENIQAAHNAGKIYCAYTLNSKQDIVRAIQMGVDMYFTNYTAKAIMLEKTYRT